MGQVGKINVGVLDKVIEGRVNPYIYAFTTETVPNYLKVGDTYRPLETRLNEWRVHFPKLEKQFEDVAKVNEETFFRDYAVHSYLEGTRHKIRLERDTIPDLPYFSNEFFKDTKVKDVEDAISDIKDSHTRNDGKYQFYKFKESRIPIIYVYPRTEAYEPRPNQQEAIDNFKTAVANGRANLLMYAVMRFGKSFTSMCCATEMGANVVVIVSAKADVKEEWKKTVESHIRFEGYEFLDSGSLSQDCSIVTKKLEGGKKVVVFLTLQDLMGGAIKERHREIFERQIDLLIIDETHFGARGEEFGKVLREELNLTQREVMSENSKTADEDLVELDATVKILSSKIRLHLSGTPYRILMGDEFNPEDIISFCQFSDIVEAQGKWDAENLDKEGINEWDNPYFGFPQMIRFAFHPNESAKSKLEELKKKGVTYALSALFKPKSIQKDVAGGMHKIFEYEKEVLDLLEVIDGSKDDDELFGFLDYYKIKAGQMCRHIVCVLPFRASCDALEKLITDNRKKFKNLSQYEIVNISGVENDRLYPDTNAVKEKIKSCERNDQKTLTLTVNRMLTGSTVEEWDTMLYLKDTSSPQEYDQATFRVQNQYIRKYTDDSGKEIRYNMKPQTLLVDLDPDRMFVLQEQKSQIYNVNTDKNGNSKLEARIEKELKISPIVTANSGKIVRVDPANIMDVVRKYSKDRSVVDEATAIPIDYSLLEDEEIRAEIEKQAKLGSKQGLKLDPTKGEGTDIDVPQVGAEGGKSEDNTPKPPKPESNKEDDFKKKFATYYSRILFFAFLTKSSVISLEDLIAETKKSEGRRIAENLEIDIKVLTLLQKKLNLNAQRNLDYKIHNINTLANDKSLEPKERATVAMRKFGRLSTSEIVTPEKIAVEMVKILPRKVLEEGVETLDLASKQGEFVYAVYKEVGEKGVKNFYSIPTSSVAYEFTRKIYELLGLDISHIESKYNSYDLIKEDTPMIKNNKIMINGQLRDFKVVISNPPYQELDGGAGVSAMPIYNKFIDKAKGADPYYITMIMPAKWYTDGKGLGGFRATMLNDDRVSKLVDYIDSRDCFDNVDIAGGICYFLWNFKHKGKCEFISKQKGGLKRSMRKLSENETFIRHTEAVKIIGKVQSASDHYFNEKVSSRKPFGLATDIKPLDEGDITLKYNKGRGPFNSSLITIGKEMIPQWKVVISYLTAEHAGQTDKNGRKKILSSLDMLAPNEICTETYLVVDAFDTKEEAENLSAYLRTCFVRFLIAQLAATQHLSKEKFAYVPIQDFTEDSDIGWSKSVAEIDLQLYDKYGLTTEERQFIEQMIRPM